MSNPISLLSSPASRGSNADREQEPQQLFITVLFTTAAGTFIALERAGQLGQQLEARIRILVPQIVPYPLAIDRPPADPTFVANQFRNSAVEGAIETSIDIRLCRDVNDAITQGLCPRSIVVLGVGNVGGPRANRAWRER